MTLRGPTGGPLRVWFKVFNDSDLSLMRGYVAILSIASRIKLKGLFAIVSIGARIHL